MSKFNLEFVGNWGQKPVPLSVAAAIGITPIFDTGESIDLQVVQQGVDASAVLAAAASSFQAVYISRLAVSYSRSDASPTAGAVVYHQDEINCAIGLPTGVTLTAGALPTPATVAADYAAKKQVLYDVSPPSSPVAKTFTGAVYNDLFMFGGTLTQVKAAVLSFLGGLDVGWFGSATVVGNINACLVSQTGGITHTYPTNINPLAIPDVTVVLGASACNAGTVSRFGIPADFTVGSAVALNSGDTTPESDGTFTVNFRIIWFPDAVASQAGAIVRYTLLSEIAPVCILSLSPPCVSKINLIGYVSGDPKQQIALATIPTPNEAWAYLTTGPFQAYIAPTEIIMNIYAGKLALSDFWVTAGSGSIEFNSVPLYYNVLIPNSLGGAIINDAVQAFMDGGSRHALDEAICITMVCCPWGHLE